MRLCDDRLVTVRRERRCKVEVWSISQGREERKSGISQKAWWTLDSIGVKMGRRRMSLLVDFTAFLDVLISSLEVQTCYPRD